MKVIKNEVSSGTVLTEEVLLFHCREFFSFKSADSPKASVRSNKDRSASNRSGFFMSFNQRGIMTGKIHIGKHIKKTLQAKRIKRKVVAQVTGIPHKELNGLLKKPSINTHTLAALSQAVGENFFQLYSQHLNEN